MRKAIVKIDLVGSTSFFSRVIAGEPWTIGRVHETLNQTVLTIFPEASIPAPKGSFVTSEGDAVILAIDKPTVALRCAIELQRKWAGLVGNIPDIRVVIDYGETSQSNDATGQARLLGSPLVVTARMEKQFGAGDIGVSVSVRRNVDATLVFFRPGPVIADAPDGSTATWRVIYDNPRTLRETTLAHALFVAAPGSEKIRERALEALIADCLLEYGADGLTQQDISKQLRIKGLPPLPAADTVDEIVASSLFLEKVGQRIVVTNEGQSLLASQRETLEQEKQAAVSTALEAISERLQLTERGDLIRAKMADTIEQFLCAVFLEIRMMANYFRATGQMFDRLQETSEFDYVLKNNFPSLASRPEAFALFKRIFLSALRKLAEGNNVYLAAIFHNVLLLYYLNRHDQTSVGALAKIKQKRIFLDTNALYAERIPSMLFHEQLSYSTNRLRELGAQICVFDISVDEYNQSLDAALKQYTSGRLAYGVAKGAAPFIWHEFTKNPGLYLNRFEACIAVFRIPRKTLAGETERDSQRRDLAERGLTLEIIPNILSQTELGDIYNLVHTVKDEKERAPERLFNRGIDFFGERVLHDANCLYWVSKQPSTRLFDADQLFVTCDFFLARVRKRSPGQFDFIMTAPEFYEFMLPYCFLNDEPTKYPVQWPNSIFGMLVESEECRTPWLSDIFSDYLSGRADLAHYEVLAETSERLRFESILEKHEQIAVAVDKRAARDEYLIAVTAGYAGYENDVAKETRKAVEADEVAALRTQLAEVRERERKLEAENEKLRVKLRGKEKIERRSGKR